jgi:hypothetical protein
LEEENRTLVDGQRMRREADGQPLPETGVDDAADTCELGGLPQGKGLPSGLVRWSQGSPPPHRITYWCLIRPLRSANRKPKADMIAIPTRT